MPELHEPIDHSRIDPDALKVVRRLVRHNHEAYLVGGCVRDLLLGRRPKDFDVATSATPEEMRRLFRNSRIIGRRFRLVHVFFGPKIIETATFRQNPRNDASCAPNGTPPDDGTPSAPAEETSLLIRRDNVFGSAEDDAKRRDFTLNGLFYDPVERRIIDYVGGKADLADGRIRTIGDPRVRFAEDPVRILRAVKFAARLGLHIDLETRAAIPLMRESILQCAHARVLEEIYRLLREGAAAAAFSLLQETGVLQVLLPELTPIYQDPSREDARALLSGRLQALDTVRADAPPDAPPLSNPVLISAVFYGVVLDAQTILEGGGNASARLDEALRGLLARWVTSRRDRDRTRQIIMAQRRLQPRMGRKRRRRPMALASQDYFPEALQLYRLLCLTGEADPSTLENWEALLERAHPRGHAEPQRKPRRRRGSRRRKRPPRKPSEQREQQEPQQPAADAHGDNARGADAHGADARGAGAPPPSAAPPSSTAT